MKKKCVLRKDKCEKIKLTILLLLTGINMGFASQVYSQSTVLSLNVNNGTVKEIFADEETENIKSDIAAQKALDLITDAAVEVPVTEVEATVEDAE